MKLIEGKKGLKTNLLAFKDVDESCHKNIEQNSRFQISVSKLTIYIILSFNYVFLICIQSQVFAVNKMNIE